MYRTCLPFLQNWLHSPRRKPLIVRGARQVGKTWLVRKLAQLEGKELIELNLESKPKLADYVVTGDPHQGVQRLGESLGRVIDPQRAILFFDEVQERPQAIAALRWFYEEMPELPVIAAGSLLEFALASTPISMPVGRVNYMYLEPFSFIEFLYALGKNQTVEFIRNYSWKERFPGVLHDDIMRLFNQYVFVGGLPDAVDTWRESQDIAQVQFVQDELLQSYRDDFSKYKTRVPYERLDLVMSAVPRMLGKKFVYSHVDQGVPVKSIKNAFHVLCRARVCHTVVSTPGQGLPLAAEQDESFVKALLLDVGLCSTSLGLKLYDLEHVRDLTLINAGGIAEQVVGQLLRTIEPLHKDPALYYWLRKEKYAQAEVDYLMQHSTYVIPVEVKAGKTGDLRSLHQFMKERSSPYAVRIYSGMPLRSQVAIPAPGNRDRYLLHSLPFYLLSEVHRLLDEPS